MGKKKNNHNHNHDNDHSNEGGEKKVEVQKKEGGEGGEKKEGKNNPMAVVLKIEMHCEGCASKVVKLARGLEGVESVKADTESNKLTLTGKVNPSQIREILHQKTKKKVDLISPQPKKEDANNNNNKDGNKKPNDKKPEADNKKPKEAPVTTAVIKVAFHCQGCIEKIHKIVSKTKGVQDRTLDKQKETVTVKGTMDVKALTEALKERLKRPVEIVPPKKEKDGNGGEKDGEKAGGGGGKKKKGGGGGDGEGGQDNAGGGGGGGDAAKMEGNRMEYMMQPGSGFGSGPGFGYMGQPVPMPVPVPVYGNGGYMGQPVPIYGNGYMGMGPQPVYEYGYGFGHGQLPDYPVHMKFNDENPNACSVM